MRTFALHATTVTQFPHPETGALSPCLTPGSQGSCEDGVCKEVYFVLGPSVTQTEPSVTPGHNDIVPLWLKGSWTELSLSFLLHVGLYDSHI